MIDSTTLAKQTSEERTLSSKHPFSNGRTLKRVLPFLTPLLIFLVAFALRALYNLAWLEHRIVHFGDAYNFLRSGTALYSAIVSAKNPGDFLQVLFATQASSVQILQSVKSTALVDRLLIDGPVYPSYLAIIQWISGVNPLNPIYEACSLKLALCNSFLDAAACLLVYVCGRLAFDRRSAIVAGLLFALYPAAIINTQHCYSEPFSYFMLTAWTALTLFLTLKHKKKERNLGFAWLALGTTTGLMMLSKPAFVMLPPLVFTVTVLLYALANRRQKLSLSGLATKASIALIGFAVVTGPWLYFNKTATGQVSLFVNRVPSFNLFHGNQLKTDGWLTYPFDGCFPGNTKAVIESLGQDAQKDPLRFVGLQFKKVARLFSGSWNEYQYSLFGISFECQSLIHQLLLYLATISLGIIFTQTKHRQFSRSYRAAVIIATIIIFHFAYIPFEAISRYAVTAMPLVVLLAAKTIVDICRRKNGIGTLCLLLGVASVVFIELTLTGKFSSFLASLVPVSMLAFCPWLSWLAGCFSLLILLGCSLQSLKTDKNEKVAPLARAIPIAAVLLSLAVSGFYAVQSQDWLEWSTTLSAGRDKLKQTIHLPVRPERFPDGAQCFVLIDMQSKILVPQLDINVNGEGFTETALPLAQLMPDNADILQCLSLQAEGMGTDFRNFRHWWVVPIDQKALRWDADNNVEIRTTEPEATVRLYGDYSPVQTNSTADGAAALPALKSYSYTKGFTTFDRLDPRAFEIADVKGKTVLSARNDQSTDLSEEPGLQYGRYRIRFLVPIERRHSVSTTASKDDHKALLETQLLSPQREWSVRGDNPLSFSPPGSPARIADGLPPGTRFNLTCRIKSAGNEEGAGFISLDFTGTDKQGNNVAWNSPWQPISISFSRQWHASTFSDIIPTRIVSLKNLQANVLFSPFLPDYLFLRKKQALKCRMLVRDAKLTLMPPLRLPDMNNRDWLLF